MIDTSDKIPSLAASNNQSRQSNIELLRIISMFLICLHHFCLISNFQWTSMTPGLYTVQCLSLGGKIGVSIFILITGYFMVNQRISGKKVIKFYLQVLFYSISIYFITTYVFHLKPYSSDLNVVFMPISNNSYWFVTTYLLVYLSSPFINIFIKALSRKLHFLLIFLCASIWIIWYIYNLENINYSEYLWMLLLYMIGAYIRIYPLQRFKNQLLNCGYFILLIVSACLALSVCNSANKSFYIDAAYFYNMNNFFVFSISLILFLIFVNIRIPDSKIINVLASATFGVYLIHESAYIRPVLWTKIFDSGSMQESPFLIPYAIGVTLLVWAACTMIDLIRKFLLEKPLMKFIDTFGPSIAVPFIHIWNEIWQKIYIDNSDAEK